MIKPRLKIVLAEKKISQKELAEKLNVRPQQVSNWTRSNPNPRLNTLFKIASILDVKVDDLFEYKEGENKEENQ